jgi:hypothetical protein
MNRLTISMAAMLLLSLAATAQDKPDFSGKWQLDVAKSDFGEFPVPDSQTNVIEQKDRNIKLTQTIRGEAVPGGEASMEREFITDNKEHSVKIGPADARSTATWNGDALVIDTKIETPAGTMQIGDSWKLTDGGKQIVVTRDFKTPQGEQHQRLVFNKQ